MTKLFLAISKQDTEMKRMSESKYVLTSFYYFKKKIPFNVDIHLVDSGAFTFFSSNKKVDFEHYLNEYIKYINEYDIKYFFELDIDVLVGYEKVLQMREKLERETGKKCIPVWHINRGKEEFIKMCKEYDYAAIGGIASGECLAKYKHLFKYLNELANRYNCKLHGLGITGKIINEANFFSVDSTTWKNGARFGEIHKFNGEYIEKRRIDKNKTIKKGEYKKLDDFNLEQWLKYQKFLECRIKK